jgi:protein NrfD
MHPLEETTLNPLRELVITRHNEMIEPVFGIWHWEIAVYLFLGGIVAGMMVVLGYFLFELRHRELRCSCSVLPGMSLVLLSLGMLALFLDLEHKQYFWRLYVTFKPASPMSWGSWILILVYPALFAAMILRLPDSIRNRFPSLRALADKARANPVFVRFVGIFCMVLGVMLGIYTGILLSTMGARPLWNSSLLGPLFLVSGLSTAAAFVHLIAQDPYERVLLAKADNAFLSIELFIIILFIMGLLGSTQVHIEAARLLLTGAFAPVFLVFVVGLGIIIPLIIQLLAVSHRIPHTPAAPIIVIAGGLILRLVFVYAGQASHW